jgi:hypothetical protein
MPTAILEQWRHAPGLGSWAARDVSCALPSVHSDVPCGNRRHWDLLKPISGKVELLQLFNGDAKLRPSIWPTVTETHMFQATLRRVSSDLGVSEHITVQTETQRRARCCPGHREIVPILGPLGLPSGNLTVCY